MTGRGDADVEALRAALGAPTDMALAAQLGVQRSAVAQWRRRGGVPAKYRFLLHQPSDAEIAAALEGAPAKEIFGHPNKRYWLRLALAVLPAAYFRESGDLLKDAAVRERAILWLMHGALEETISSLRKPMCESEEDFAVVLARFMAGRERWGAQLLELFPPPSPQSSPQSAID